MTKLISLLLLFIICIAGIALSLVNTVPVTFNYYFNQIEFPLSLLLSLTFVAGVFTTLILILPTLIKLKFLAKAKSATEQQNRSEALPLIKPQED